MNKEKNLPLVSICCSAYNHVNYIKDSIQGFIIQKTSFPFEILIHDDASTDGTTEIVKDYEHKYASLIKPIYQKDNQYSKGISPGNINRKRATGKYIAICEGDDYWTDPYKLQKQVDFLESNPEYGLVHGDCHFFYQDRNKWLYNANKSTVNSTKEYSKEELFSHLIISDYIIRTSTVLYRKELLEKRPPNGMNFIMGDTPMWLDFSQITKFKYLNEVFAVYRISSNTISRSKDKIKQLRFNLSMYEMRVYFLNKYNYPISKKIMKRYNDALLDYKLYNKKYKGYFPLLDPSHFQILKEKCLKKSDKYFIYYLEILRKIINKCLKKINENCCFNTRHK